MNNDLCTLASISIRTGSAFSFARKFSYYLFNSRNTTCL